MIRAFIALEMPAALRSALAVQQFLLPLPRRVPVENLHLTLLYLGEVPDRDLEALHDGLGALHLPAVEIELAGLGLFGGDRPTSAHAVVRRSEPLAHLQAKIATVAHRAGVVTERRRFQPHVTLGRFQPPPLEDRLRLERAVAEQGGFRAGPALIDSFVLFRSTRHRDGARYDALARYPLGGQRPGQSVAR